MFPPYCLHTNIRLDDLETIEEWIEIRDEDVEQFRAGELERTYKEVPKGAAELTVSVREAIIDDVAHWALFVCRQA